MGEKLKAKYEVYAPRGGTKTKWDGDDVIRQYDGLLSKEMAEANAWRAVGLIGVILIAIAVGLLIHVEKKPKTELVVVSVNDLGQARYVGTTRGINFDEFDMWEPTIKNLIKEFLNKTYTVSIDADLMYRNFQECLYVLDKNKRSQYQLQIKSEDPFSLVGQKKREIEIETIIPISDMTYQADFKVLETDLSGYGLRVKKQRGIFTLQQVSSEGYQRLKDEERINNPSGIFIIEYSIAEVK